MARWLLLLLLAGCEPAPSCFIDDVVERHVGTAVVTDCGRVMFDDERFDVARYTEVRACVLDAVARQAPFRAAWSEDDFEYLYFDHYVGIARDGTLEISVFSMDVAPEGPDGDMINLPTSRTTCATLVDLGNCERENESLCLACEGSVAREACPD